MSEAAIDATLPGAEPVRHVAAQLLAASGRWRACGDRCSGSLALRAALPAAAASLLLNEIAILALFALSLDLILGYAGIVSLGHAAFFGLGAYSAGLLAQARLWRSRCSASASPAVLAAVLGFATSFLLLRGTDLTRLMVTLGIALLLGELANRMALADRRRGRPAGHYGRADPRPLRVRPLRPHGLCLQPVRAVRAVPARAADRPLALRAVAARGEGQPAPRPLHRHLGQRAPRGASTRCRRPMRASPARCCAQTTQFVSLDVLDFHRSADVLLVLVHRRRRLPLRRHRRRGGLQGDAGRADRSITPQYWQFWIGLILVVAGARGARTR